MLPDFGCKHALLLQGPAGPFFRRFAGELRDAGIDVTKVNLHSGDVLFFPGPSATSFRGTLSDWPRWLRDTMRERRIDAVFLFGDCRPYHRAAIRVAHELGATPWVFEEGYLRPDYITLEREGVNGYSTLPREPSFYLSRVDGLPETKPPEAVGPSFAISAWYSALNSLAFTLFRAAFPHYEHHRPLNAWKHTRWWVIGASRKLWFGTKERNALSELIGPGRPPYYFVPLQVHCDFQLLHSPYGDVREFIEEVVAAFAKHAQPMCRLVLKHHPMDRPFRDYTADLRQLAQRYDLQDRLRYVHDVHLPTLLKNARGTITINSTVGLSSIHHGTPVKVMGTAVYDMPGLTYPGTLAEFFRASGAVDAQLYGAFRRYLLRVNQANGNLYRRLRTLRSGTGVRWFPGESRPDASSR